MDIDPEIRRIFESQRAHALALRVSTATDRISRLRRLRDAIKAREADVCRACHEDFRKPEPEARLAELLPVYSEIGHAIRALKRWMKPVRVRPTWPMLGTRAEIRYEPKGVCLIIAPWNYPFQLALGPLVSALAAGNTAIIKPSEMTPAVSKLLATLVRDTFEPHEVAVFEGDRQVAGALLKLPFDHVFFTGSPAVGRIVMEAAARNLSSVTLELGGKSPVVIGPTADIGRAARHIAWGKLTNNGQTCIAPDYAFVHESVLDPFLGALERAVENAYGKTAEARRASPDYCRIVNAHHFERLQTLYDDALARGARVVFGGAADAGERYFAPTVLTGVPEDARMMQEEIFGPLLPVLPYSEIGQVIRFVNARPKPLALYVFSRDPACVEAVLGRTSSGGACVNHNLLHYGHVNLPFGGVNHSGLGKAHGKFGFEAFSNQKPVLTDRFNAMHLLYPPYTRRVQALVKWLVRKLR